VLLFKHTKSKTLVCCRVCIHIRYTPRWSSPDPRCIKVCLRHFIGQNRHNKARKRYSTKFCTTKLLFLLYFITDRVSVTAGYTEIIAYFRPSGRFIYSGCTKQNTTKKLRIYIYKEYKNTPPHQKRYMIPYP
jgi:hypothetical protein